MQLRPSLVSGILLMGAASLIAPSAAAHHRFEIGAVLGYRVGGHVGAAEDSETLGNYSFDGAPAYGALFAYRVRPDGLIFLSYERQETQARFTPSGLASSVAQAGVSIEYFQFGGSVERAYGRTVRFVPYMGASVGLARLAALGRNVPDEWAFAPVLDGGFKIELLPWLHLRAAARLPISFFGTESAVLCLTGSNCTVGVDRAPRFQFDMLGGIGASF
ncbi:MAG: hypothetical protein B6A08_17505 [Sorangiineae bacterium NIC37A_2]|nr:MAG: hypothetical protein B6A08_20040 [Sorangiineae bacterium NIC37A_2]OQX67030.1 MAG: hypothetical protein B6A08_17505 [Sorangiineae bacterium NIC37A_2]